MTGDGISWKLKGSQPPNMLPSPRTLSPREIQVLEMIATGHSRKQVAFALCISRHTVRTYMLRIKIKLGTDSDEHSACVALVLGLITVEVPEPCED